MKLPETATVTGDHETVTGELLQSLLHSIQKTQSFKGKWSLIETKVSDLKTLLSDVSDFPPNSISGDLIRSLTQTLSDALSLSVTCHTASLPAGKLKTQNDVDSITAKLDNHIRDLDVVVKSGVLHDGVVSVSKSSNSKISKRDSVRVEARSLVTRLQIGSVDSRTFALDSLLKLIQEDDKNVLIAVAQGVVPVLVRLLDSGSSPEIREKTVTAIARVSTVDSSKHVLLAEGLLLLHYLIKVLESGNDFAKQKACVTLQTLTLSKENAKAIESRGGISSLLDICQSGTPPSQAAAAAVLRNLTEFSDCRENFIEEHAVSVLLTLARSGTALAQEHSIACLSNLVKDDDDLKLLIVRKGGLISLKSFWDSASVKSLEVAVEFLSNLASDQRLIEVIISNDFLIRLLNSLNCGVLGVRTHAAEAVYKIGYNSKTRKELGELGFIPVLNRMLDGKSVEEIQAAAKALSTILVYTENRRVYRKDPRGVVSVVRLLDPSITNLDKKYPVSILNSLTHSKKCRKQMVKAGALSHLEKLVAMDVEGAKSLQEAIGGGKLFGVFRIRS
ncbi:putative armadillo-like helical protein [Helianthus debilis subsp. tardiflorus]